MTDMTPSPEAATAEPTTMAEALAPFRAKLRARGLDPDALPPTKPEPHGESPEEAQERRQRKLDNYAARWKALVPVMYQDANVEALEAEAQHAVRVRSWLRSGSLHLVLAGAVGTGKTYAAYAVGNQALAAGMWVEAWTVPDLMDALRPGSTDHGAESRARNCQLLILDDLTAKATDWEAERLTMLLDARVREERQTLVTTNITSQQIQEVWGTRTMDRLRYRLTALTFTGESRRTAAW